jgi:hypothetical protein
MDNDSDNFELDPEPGNAVQQTASNADAYCKARHPQAIEPRSSRSARGRRDATGASAIASCRRPMTGRAHTRVGAGRAQAARPIGVARVERRFTPLRHMGCR